MVRFQTPAPALKRSYELGKAGPRAVGIIAAALIIAGYAYHPDQYITPKNGLGYALGITGASMLALLFLYSAKKRWPRAFPRSEYNWFWWHPLLGIFGPIAILYHTGFHLGAGNARIAMCSMWVTVISGLIGRYLYNRKHLAKFDQWFEHWRMFHLPFLAMLLMAGVIHIVSTFFY